MDNYLVTYQDEYDRVEPFITLADAIDRAREVMLQGRYSIRISKVLELDVQLLVSEREE